MLKIQTGRGTIPLNVLVAIWSVSAVVSLPGLAISPILGDLDKIFKHAIFFISIGEYANKRIHPFAGSLAQCHICNFYHSLNLICFSLIESGGKGKK